MKFLHALPLCLCLVVSPAFAAGSHSGGHGHDDESAADDHHGQMTVGIPGEAAQVRRNITIEMAETADGDMIFKPASVKVKKGETIRFRIVNKGELEHEFVLDDHDGIIEHKGLMERFPEMEHDDPNSVRLAPGEKGDVVWQFTNAGEFEFACLIPGHFDLGMKGALRVSGR